MEGPPRANAAQLAARKIKEKPRTKRSGSPHIVSSGPQFGQQQQQPQTNGGLFGGSVQASGTFNFTGAPSAPSFPPTPSFGDNNTFSSGVGNMFGANNAHSSDREAERLSDDRPAKRQFGVTHSAPQQNGNIFQMPNGFAQNPSSTPNNMFAPSAPTQNGSNLFGGITSAAPSQPNSFTFTPSQSAGPSFGANTSISKPASSSFSFGQTAEAPKAPSIFSPTDTNSEAKSSSSFTFGSTAKAPASPAPSTSGFTFGATPAAQSSSKDIFSSQFSAAPPANPFANLTPATQSPAKELFPAAQTPSVTSSNLFGPSTATGSKPSTTNLFSNLQSTEPPSSGIFAKQTPTSTNGASNLFAPAQAPAQNTSNIFGNLSQPTTTTPNFGQSKSQTTNNIFGNLSQPSSSGEQSSQPADNMLTSQDKPTESTSNIFGTPKSTAEPPRNIFSTATTAQAQSPNKLFGAAPQSQAQSPQKPPFAAPQTQAEQPKEGLFSSEYKASLQRLDQSSNLHSSADKPATATNAFTATSKPLFEAFAPSKPFGSESHRPASPEKSSLPSNLFSHLNKPLSQSAATSESNGIEKPLGNTPVATSPLKNGAFGSPNNAQSSSNSRPEPSMQIPASPIRAGSLSLGVPQKRLDWPMPDWSKYKGYTSTPINSSATKISPKNIPYFMEPAAHLKYHPEVTSLLDSIWKQETQENFRAYDAIAPKIPEKASSTSNQDGTPKNLAKDYPGLAFAKTFPLEYMARFVPDHFSAELRVQFYAAYRINALEHEMNKFRATTYPGYNTMPADTYKQTQRKHILQRATVEYSSELEKLGKEPVLTGTLEKNKTKRLAGDDESQENEPPSKRTKSFGSSNSASSITPQSKEQALSTTSNPTFFTQPQTNGNVASTPSFSFSQPAASQPSSLASPSRGKRKGDDLDQDTPQPKRNSPLKALKGAGGGSNTSNLFKEIVDSPAKTTSPAKPISERKTLGSPTKPAATDAPRFNPFGSLPVPPSPNAGKVAPSSVGNIFSPQPSSPNKVSSNIFAAATGVSSGGLFSPKSSSDISKLPSTDSLPQSSSASKTAEQKPAALAMPKFVASSGMAQFAAQAAKDAQDSEQKYLQKRYDEDFDSDDGETKEEFFARVKEERAAERAQLKEISSKENPFKFVASQNEAPKSPPKSTPSPSLFGQKAQESSSGLLSLNGSRTSTPGLVSSPGSSVLDGHTSNKKVAFGTDFFSKPSPGSVQDDDADDEHADDDAEGESDSENKDPNYQPGQDGPSGPGTPASETGEGIASAKKAQASFNFGQAKSGGLFGTSSTSGSTTPVRSLEDRMSRDSNGELIRAAPTAEKENTPVRSLEDRMSKDSNGNLIRQIPTEEKENTQPSTTNLFANLNNPFSAPKFTSSATDKTWKQDSPIKFGGSTGDAPAFSFTAATPSKTPSVLFGSTKDSGPQATNGSQSLLSTGNSASSKPSLTFSFGASSATSSLMPSAAVSATTSRATTPGGTTDGESGVDADPDAERHDQLDLTSGGPGEEDEEVLHEVRTKAQKHVKQDDGSPSWVVQGLGPLRVLKNKDTKNTRILIRGDPTGKVIFNRALLPNMKYEPSGKTVKVMALSDDGQGLETWLMQVKTEEAAKALAKSLESNKTP